MTVRYNDGGYSSFAEKVPVNYLRPGEASAADLKHGRVLSVRFPDGRKLIHISKQLAASAIREGAEVFEPTPEEIRAAIK
jgi:hypothetical protein